jgi:hypothetical protein
MRNLILFIILSSLLSCHSPGKNEVNLLILKLSHLENSVQEINYPEISTALEGYKENIDLVSLTYKRTSLITKNKTSSPTTIVRTPTAVTDQ